MTTPHETTSVAQDPPSALPRARAATAPVDRNGVVLWTLRLAGLHAVVNGAGFGAFTLPAAWHLAHDHTVWYAFQKPTYGRGPFEDHGIDTNVPLLLAFFGVCLALAIGGALLLVPRPSGVVLTLAGMVLCAPFWWGFDLPLAWINAGVIAVLLALASAVQVIVLLGPAPRRSANARGTGNSKEPSANNARTRTSQDHSPPDTGPIR